MSASSPTASCRPRPDRPASGDPTAKSSCPLCSASRSWYAASRTMNSVARSARPSRSAAATRSGPIVSGTESGRERRAAPGARGRSAGPVRAGRRAGRPPVVERSGPGRRGPGARARRRPARRRARRGRRASSSVSSTCIEPPSQTRWCATNTSSRSSSANRTGVHPKQRAVGQVERSRRRAVPPLPGRRPRGGRAAGGVRSVHPARSVVHSCTVRTGPWPFVRRTCCAGPDAGGARRTVPASSRSGSSAPACRATWCRLNTAVPGCSRSKTRTPRWAVDTGAGPGAVARAS